MLTRGCARRCQLFRREAIPFCRNFDKLLIPSLFQFYLWISSAHLFFISKAISFSAKNLWLHFIFRENDTFQWDLVNLPENWRFTASVLVWISDIQGETEEKRKSIAGKNYESFHFILHANVNSLFWLVLHLFERPLMIKRTKINHCSTNLLQTIYLI